MENVDKGSKKQGNTADKSKVDNSNFNADNNHKADSNDKKDMNFSKAISEYGEAKGWKNILSDLRQNGKIMLYSNLLKAKAIELNDMVIGISFPEGINAFGKSIIEKPENINELSRIVSMEYGKDMKVRLVENVEALPKKEKKNENQLEQMAENLDIPINIIE